MKTITEYFNSLCGSECDMLLRAEKHAARIAEAKSKLAAGLPLFHACGFAYWGEPKAPSSPHWASSLSKAQRPRVAKDLAALAAARVGDSVECVKSFHPKHGERFTYVTRIA